MSAAQLRTKDITSLEKELIELRKEQFNLRMQKATGQLGNPARFGQVRREIARVKTVITEKAAAPA